MIEDILNFRNAYNKGAVALSPTKKTNRSLPKGIERFAAFVYNKIAKHHQTGKRG